jgi:glutaredoxin
MLKVTLYSKYNCQWCEMLKVRLINLKIDYTELRVDDNVDNLEKLRELILGVKTVPQMFVDEVGLIGTYEQSTAWLNGYSYGKACWCATHDPVTHRFIGGDEGKS